MMYSASSTQNCIYSFYYLSIYFSILASFRFRITVIQHSVTVSLEPWYSVEKACQIFEKNVKNALFVKANDHEGFLAP